MTPLARTRLSSCDELNWCTVVAYSTRNPVAGVAHFWSFLDAQTARAMASRMISSPSPIGHVNARD
jgi:hypothetical protein